MKFMNDKDLIDELIRRGLPSDIVIGLIDDARPETCEKPNCNCIEIAERNNGGNPVKSYPCRAKVSDMDKEKSSVNKGDGWIKPLPFIS